MQKEDRLYFCINLEVVNLEVEIQRLFFGRNYGLTILFRDKLTFIKVFLNFRGFVIRDFCYTAVYNSTLPVKMFGPF